MRPGRMRPAAGARASALRGIAAALLLGEEALELRAEFLGGRHVVLRLLAQPTAVAARGEGVVLLLESLDDLGALVGPLDLPANLQRAPVRRPPQLVPLPRQA